MCFDILRFSRVLESSSNFSRRRKVKNEASFACRSAGYGCSHTAGNRMDYVAKGK